MRETLKHSFFIVLALFFVYVIRGSVIEGFRIPSESMMPTLKISDHILVWKLSYGLTLPWSRTNLFTWRTPERNQVVVFRRQDDSETTSTDESKNYVIKRIIGLPGETVEVSGTTVLINNQPLTEHHAKWKYGGLPEGNFGPLKVPPGHLFMLGDNRDQSQDSRFWGKNPFVPSSNIVGKAFIIYRSKEFSRILKFVN